MITNKSQQNKKKNKIEYLKRGEDKEVVDGRKKETTEKKTTKKKQLEERIMPKEVMGRADARCSGPSSVLETRCSFPTEGEEERERAA